MMLSPFDVQPFSLVPAKMFSLEELAAAYNQGRVDEPLNDTGFDLYLKAQAIDLDTSLLALDAHERSAGLALVGVRGERAWISVSVSRDQRQAEVARALLPALLSAVGQRCSGTLMVEVGQADAASQGLLARAGFRQLDDLVALRREAGAPGEPAAGNPNWFSHSTALTLLGTRKTAVPWTVETAVFRSASQVEGVAVSLPSGGLGWAIFQRQPSGLSHLVLHTQSGDPAAVGAALLGHLHQRYPELAVAAESIRAGDAHLPAFAQHGYYEVARRSELLLNAPPAEKFVFARPEYQHGDLVARS
jgi:hypothetical protein